MKKLIKYCRNRIDNIQKSIDIAEKHNQTLKILVFLGEINGYKDVISYCEDNI